MFKKSLLIISLLVLSNLSTLTSCNNNKESFSFDFLLNNPEINKDCLIKSLSLPKEVTTIPTTISYNFSFSYDPNLIIKKSLFNLNILNYEEVNEIMFKLYNNIDVLRKFSEVTSLDTSELTLTTTIDEENELGTYALNLYAKGYFFKYKLDLTITKDIYSYPLSVYIYNFNRYEPKIDYFKSYDDFINFKYDNYNENI